MRIALLSDIHGNIVGLEAVLAQIERFGGADYLFALGDFLAVGPGADDVIDLILKHNIRMVRGNWDEIFIDLEAYLARCPADGHAFVLQNYDWLQRNVSRDAQRLLAGLPLTDQVEVAPGQRLFVCHAAPDDTWSRACHANTPTQTLRSIYGQIEADVIAYGHYHAHHTIHLDRRILLNVASVGMKRGHLSAFTLLEYADERWTVQQFQVPYEAASFEHLSRARGVPMRTS